jgi:hypothetical protein
MLMLATWSSFGLYLFLCFLPLFNLRWKSTALKAGIDPLVLFPRNETKKKKKGTVICCCPCSTYQFFSLVSNQISIKSKGTPKYMLCIQKKHLTGKRKKIKKEEVMDIIKAATVPILSLINDSQQHVHDAYTC